ncbi:MAG TPA: hypothetical protein VIB48_04645 [Acidimicrobiia bacterium]|jgi:hypothetical protein
MTHRVPASALRTGDHFSIDGSEHAVVRVVDSGGLLWVKTERGKLVPIHETESVLLVIDDAPVARPLLGVPPLRPF